MKAFADIRMTTILERQDALRRDAARSRLVSRPADGFAVDDDLETVLAMTVASIPNEPAVGDRAERTPRADRSLPGGRPAVASTSRSGGHPKGSSGHDCREGSVAA